MSELANFIDRNPAAGVLASAATAMAGTLDNLDAMLRTGSLLLSLIIGLFTLPIVAARCYVMVRDRAWRKSLERREKRTWHEDDYLDLNPE